MMIDITSTSRAAFSAAVSRYAAVRKKSFAYAVLRGCRTALYAAIGNLPRGQKAAIQALERSVRWRSWILTRAALGRVPGVRLARGKFGLWRRADAAKNARKIVRVRASRLGWRVAFLVRAIKWLTGQLKPYNTPSPAPSTKSARARKLAAIRNRSYVKATEVAVLCDYTIKNALTAAGQNAAQSTAALNSTFAAALSRGLAAAASDMQSFCDAHTARHAPQS